MTDPELRPAQHVGTSGATLGPGDSVVSPRVAHVPDDAPMADPAAPRPRHRVARLAAGISVCALVGTLALPLVQQSNALETPAAQQKLFSEITGDDVPSTLTEVAIVDTDEPSTIGYEFRARSVVNYPFASPVPLTDPFGYRTAPVAQFHDAQDFGAGAGTPVLAIADGTVLEAGYATDGCGFGLKLEHEIDGQEVTSRYCHMQNDSHTWKVGDTIKMGEPAGKVGATGIAFGAHLHLALRVNDTAIDPMPFLAKYYRLDRDAPARSLQSATATTEPATTGTPE